MSRHRFVRGMDYEDDYDDEYDEDEYDSAPKRTSSKSKPKAQAQSPAKPPTAKPKASPSSGSASALVFVSPARPKTSTEPAPAEPAPSDSSASAIESPAPKYDTEQAENEFASLAIDDKQSPATSPATSPMTSPSTKPSKKKPVIVPAMPEDAKRTVNLVVIGHVDAGKSTIVGHLLVQMGEVDKRVIQRHKKESEAMGKKSFHFAFVMDDTDTERSRGVTVNCSHRVLNTPNSNCRICLVDAPGHRDFIPNMISGTSMADAALLVIDARPGEFESGFLDGGQTKEHALLAKSLGVSQVIVAVNKMDTVEWTKHRFDNIRDQIREYLNGVGFKNDRIAFIPLSGYGGENLTEPYPACTWYSGPTVLQALEGLEAPPNSIDKPLRVCVSDVFVSQAFGLAAIGKIDSGALCKGSQLTLMPSSVPCTVRGLYDQQGNMLEAAYAGETATISLSELPPDSLSAGCVLSDPNNCIQSCTRIEGRILTHNSAVPLLKGSTLMLHSHSVSVQATVSRLLSLLDRTGGVIAKKPRCIPKNSAALVEITLSKPVVLDVSSNSKTLGRFTLRDVGQSVGFGVITKILPASSKSKDKLNC